MNISYTDLLLLAGTAFLSGWAVCTWHKNKEIVQAAKDAWQEGYKKGRNSK